jgi:hypothetical protein
MIAANLAFTRQSRIESEAPAWSEAISFRLRNVVAPPLILMAICFPNDARAAQPEAPTAQEDAPPVIKLPLDIIEPPRLVKAAEWNAPYCRHWDDGCTECTKLESQGVAQCHDEPHSQASACQRRAIICFTAIDGTYFDRVCQRYIAIVYSRSGDGSIAAMGKEWIVDWHLIQGQWTPERRPVYLQQLLNLPPIRLSPDPGEDLTSHKRPNSYLPNTPPLASAASGIQCERSYAKERSTPRHEARDPKELHH